MTDLQLLPGAEPWSVDGGPPARSACMASRATRPPCAGGRGLRRRGFLRRAAPPSRPRHDGGGHDDDDLDGLDRRGRGGLPAPAARTDKVVVAGLSMGGSLTLWTALQHPEVAGIVCINPATKPQPAEIMEMLHGMVDEGTDLMRHRRRHRRSGRHRERLCPDASATADLAGRGRPCAVERALRRDHVPAAAPHQPPGPRGRAVQRRLPGRDLRRPAERISLDRSYHVATLDFDKDVIFEAAVAFGRKVTG